MRAMPMVAPVPAASVRDEAANEPRPAAKGARGVVLVTREADDGGAAPPVRVLVTIESLETHFAPVETVNASVAEAASAGALLLYGVRRAVYRQAHRVARHLTRHIARLIRGQFRHREEHRAPAGAGAAA